MFHPYSCFNSYAGSIVIIRSDYFYHDVCVCVSVCVQNYKYVHLEHFKWCISAHLKALDTGIWGVGWEGQLYAMTAVAVYVYMHVFTQVCTLGVCNQFGVSCQSLSNKY